MSAREPETLQALLRGLAAHGDAPAIIAFTGEHAATTSFAALDRAARTLGAALGRMGAGPGACVAITGPNGPAWITAFWAIVATGASVLAIDAQVADGDLAHMLETGGCRLVFTTAARAERLPPGITAIALDRDLPSAPDGDTAALPAVSPGDVAVLLFTSGTTGTPKAVPLSHANVMSNVRALGAARLVAKGDRALLPLPLHHAYPLTVGMMTGLSSGVAIILPAGVSGPELVTAMQRGPASVLLGVPRLYSALLTAIRARVAAHGQRAARLFARLVALAIRLRPVFGTRLGRLLFRALHRQLAPDLRLLVSGGAKLDTGEEATLGALGWAVMTGYGLTETSPILAFNRPGASRAGSAGRALPGVELRITNADAGGVGEVEARGASVFAGYRGDAAATQRAFTADGWFRTGDFGRIDRAGYLFIVARVSETIVLADGKKLFPEAVEAVYAEHALIKEIALLAVDGALVGLVVPDLDAVRAAGAVRLKELLRDALAAEARALPSHARLSGFAVARDKLPRTQLGKLRRHLLPALYAEALEGRAPTGPAELTPEDKTLLAEPAAAAAWDWLKARFAGRVLDLDMSPQLDLGIDSLAWIDLTLAFERDLGTSLTEQEIARIVTLRDLVRALAAAPGKPKEDAAPAPVPADALPPLGPLSRLLQTAGGALVRIIMRRLFKLTVEGVAHVPATGPFLLCANHQSYLDPLAIVAALPAGMLRRTWWGGWTGILYTTRLRRFLSRVAQIVPIDQDRAAGATLAMAGLVLARGEVLVWFPEGGLTRDGKMRPFLPGVGALLVRHPVPIVPLLITGSFAAWPAGRPRPVRLNPITLRFGQPLDPAALLAEAPGDGRAQRIADAVKAAVAALGGIDA